MVSPKTTTSRSNATMTHPTKEVTNSGSSGRGKKNSPSGNIESSYKVPLKKKGKM
jgi:hypothetical protein